MANYYSQEAANMAARVILKYVNEQILTTMTLDWSRLKLNIDKNSPRGVELVLPAKVNYDDDPNCSVYSFNALRCYSSIFNAYAEDKSFEEIAEHVVNAETEIRESIIAAFQRPSSLLVERLQDRLTIKPLNNDAFLHAAYCSLQDMQVITKLVGMANRTYAGNNKYTLGVESYSIVTTNIQEEIERLIVAQENAMVGKDIKEGVDYIIVAPS